LGDGLVVGVVRPRLPPTRKGREVSTRATKWDLFGRIHVFWDVNNPGWYVDIGRNSYNRAWKIWPPTFKRLY
jgi:hypothetical protein